MKVSVALCTCNGEKFIKKQLESILHQTVEADEIIIYDDCSTDSTFSVLETYQNAYPQLIKLYRQEINIGTLRNFENAIKKCTGDIIFLADQDDIWYPYKVQVMLDYFDNNAYAMLVFTDGDLIDEAGNTLNKTLWQAWDFNKELQERWMNNNFAFDDIVRNRNRITGATIAFKAVLKEHIFPFIKHPFFWHDAWVGMYAAKQQGLFFIQQPLIQYRVHAKQLVGIRNGITYTRKKTSVKDFARKVKRRLQRFVK